MTSSGCLSNNNHDDPRLSTRSHTNLSVRSFQNPSNELLRTSSFTATTMSASPNNFYVRPPMHQSHFPQANMYGFPRIPPPPPPAPTLTRRNIEFKPPEQDILDKNFFDAFNIEQKPNKNTNHNTPNTINEGKQVFSFMYLTK